MKLNAASRGSLFSVVVLLAACWDLGFCGDGEVRLIRKIKPVFGAFCDRNGMRNSAEIVGVARFAVEEYNKEKNTLLEFRRVLKAKEQVVAGKIYHLTLEAVDTGKRKIYEAKVWIKPWMNFKELQEFKHAQYAPKITSLGSQC
ncbi:cysteine proteinase inhibitor A [Malania oleifera]|uniref:cysteine proteinase inhibitor A n=1 Tax=Malania oleifera TaxID=397392 RepID=UPI0025ADC9AE|nr:cysteine proteinase inhibitor A [Malania oleifera]